MAIRLTTTAMGGLPVLVAKQLTLVTSGTPSAVSSMKTILGAALSTGVAGTVIVTCAQEHGLSTNDWVRVANASSHSYLNGDYQITVSSSTVFTYVQAAAAGLLSETGDVTVLDAMFQQALIISDPNNAAAISFGPNTNADLYSIPIGGTFRVDAPSGAKLDLNDWSMKSASASQVLRILLL